MFNYKPPKEIRPLFIIHYAPLILVMFLGPITPIYGFFRLPIAQLISIGLGIVVLAAGYGLFIKWTIFWHKKYKGQLIANGIFKYIRHPHYSSLLILGFGLALFFSSILSLLLAIMAVPIMLWSAIDEEKLLIKQYGKKYEKYLEKVPWRFIPKIL